MSIFGYPATIRHFSAIVDDWGRVTGYTDVEKVAKVKEEQKLIRTTSKVENVNVFSSEDVLSVAEIHLEGSHKVTTEDYFEYTNQLNEIVRFNVKNVEIKKKIGTDEVKKVIVYA